MVLLDTGIVAIRADCLMPDCRSASAAGHCPTLGPKAHLGPEGRVGLAVPPYGIRAAGVRKENRSGQSHRRRRFLLVFVVTGWRNEAAKLIGQSP
jgi:hypothetical protein